MSPYAKPVIYADDRSMLITANSLNGLKTKVSFTLNYMDERFSVTGLSLNIDKAKVNLVQTIFTMISFKLLIKIRLWKQLQTLNFSVYN
jgi:hypothetical protein